ncbi:MAG: hypothetical protein PVF58_09555 [Candidatus Methanofastidiosia archaeon]|jgi:hypothetical protein
MIKIQFKRLKDFKRLIEGRKTVYFKQNAEKQKFMYYVISKQDGVGIINVFRSTHPLKFTDGFDPEEPDCINVGFLVEIEAISSLHKEVSPC